MRGKIAEGYRVRLLGIIAPRSYMLRPKSSVCVDIIIERLNALPLPQKLKTRIAGNAHQPGGELGASLEIAEMLKCFQERILHRIASLLRVSQDPNQGPVNAPVMAVDEIFECVDVTTLHA